MKVKELIKQLQTYNPELEVTVGKASIWFVHTLPCYYDGCCQVLKHDESKIDTEYSVIGAEIREEGSHVSIETLSVERAIMNDPDIPVTYDSKKVEEKYAERVKEWRQEARRKTIPKILPTNN